MTTQQLQSPINTSEFDGEEYGTGIESLPYLQMLNHDDPQRAVSDDNVLGGWRHPSDRFNV